MDKTYDSSDIDCWPSTVPEDFREIAPYDEAQYHQAIRRLIKEPGFEHAVRFCLPGVDYSSLCDKILTTKTQKDFQRFIMRDFLERLAEMTTSRLSVSGIENCQPGVSYTFISNHRDIVLDASFLNLCFIRHNLPITQIAIGNNLLIYDWITDLVKINRSFIVKRDVGISQALKAAVQLSKYIHYTLGECHESVWIAQREGRAKDSSDNTQESLIKMLSLAGDGDVKQNLLEVNLNPVSISYEYDPNDFLKAREFLLKHRDPAYKKTTRDDLFSMETGLLSQKGQVHFHIGPCINQELSAVTSECRSEVIKAACDIIDRTIHKGYKIFPINYIAYDEIAGGTRFADHYTSEELNAFNAYIEGQINKTGFEDLTKEDRKFLRDTILLMYSNPLRNLLLAEGKSLD